MESIEIGAFEAKTHFSQLLREVEKGVTVHITRRGKPVAVLKQEEQETSEDPLAALDRLSRFRRSCPTAEITELRDSGRER